MPGRKFSQFDTSPEAKIGINPAAGANYILIAPISEFWLIHSVYFTVTADANIAVRIPWIQSINSLGNLINFSKSNLGVAAGISQSWNFDTCQINFNPSPIHNALPFNFFIFPGGSLVILIESIQAGDTITAIRIVLQKFAA